VGNAIEVHGMTKRYGNHEAVRGIDFEVAAGEVFCLLGPNGAGKTTTVEILEGFRSRTAGTVRVLGFDPEGQPVELRERIGIVLQECALPGELRVAELVDSYRSYYRHPLALADLLAAVDLEDDARRLVRDLSGGQRRRVDLALALAGDPELIFLDEPTTGFDPQARRAAWETIRSLRALGKTILLTTHYLDEAQALADRVAIVKDGRVLAIGPPRELGVGSGGETGHAGGLRYKVTYRGESGELVERETEDPTALLHELTGEALASGRRLEELSVGRPTLEDVYLELTAAPSGERDA